MIHKLWEIAAIRVMSLLQFRFVVGLSFRTGNFQIFLAWVSVFLSAE